MWNLGQPPYFKDEQTQCNGDDSHPTVSPMTWLKMKRHVERSWPNLPIYVHVLWWCKPFSGVSTNQSVKTSQSLNLLLSFSSKLISMSKKCLKLDFVERIRRILCIITECLLSKMPNENSQFGNELNHFECDFLLNYVFSPHCLFPNEISTSNTRLVKFYIFFLCSLSSQSNFCIWTLLLDFSVNTYSNQDFFDFMDFSWSILWKSQKTLISHLNYLSDLIKF